MNVKPRKDGRVDRSEMIDKQREKYCDIQGSNIKQNRNKRPYESANI